VSQPFTRSNNQPFSRRTISRRIREEAAEIAFLRPHPDHPNNGDENDYSNRNYVGNYSKGLPHFDCSDGAASLVNIGEVKPQPYRRMLRALASGQPYFFGRIPLGGTRRLVNPQSGLAFDLEGPDSHALKIPPAPRLDSQEVAGEMIEVYWMALLRDVNFGSGDFNASSNPDIGTAANELSNLPIFKGPKQGGAVTPNTIFRGFTRGDLIGPYVSQFLLVGTESDALPPGPADPPLNPLTLRYITYGSLRIDQKQRTILPGDFLTNFGDWLNGEQGVDSIPPNDQACGSNFDPTRRYIRNMRDLANHVHFDDLPQEFWNTALILQHLERPCEPTPRGPGDRGNPYVSSENQDGFGTLGDPNILALIGEVTTRALKAAWFQKWFVHRRLRPEEFGALIHKQYAVNINAPCPVPAGSFNYPFDRNILNPAGPFTVLNRIFNHPVGNPSNSYLLPQVYPEASPLHPSCPSGHATIAGACVTMLKAWFDESFVIPTAVMIDPAHDGTPQEGTRLTTAVDGAGNPLRLTVGDELNKLASNIAIGRNMAGVHYRSDYVQGLLLGEAVAIGLLEEQKNTYNENFYLTLTRFDGQAITI
jgi:membrane-associated phospholipid phosphatase